MILVFFVVVFGVFQMYFLHFPRYKIIVTNFLLKLIPLICKKEKTALYTRVVNDH